MTIAADLAYYSDLLIVQYRTKTKAVKTVQLIVNQNLIDDFVLTEAGCFDLDTAVGAQLDILGRIVGVPRNVLGLDLSHTFFNFTTYPTNAASNGFGRYAVPEGENPPLFWSYRTSSKAIYTLVDAELLLLIKLKIIYNTSYSSLKNIVDLLWDFFGDQITVVDNKDMTITYYVKPSYSNALIAAAYLGYLPKPMGVDADIVYT